MATTRCNSVTARNTVTAGNGNDQVQLGNGTNTVTLGAGNNTVTAGNGNDQVHLGNGTNTVTLAPAPTPSLPAMATTRCTSVTAPTP